MVAIIRRGGGGGAGGGVPFGGGIPVSGRCLWTGPNGVTTANWSALNTPGTFRQRHPLAADCTNVRLVFFGYGQSGQSGHDGEENPNNVLGAEVFTTLTVRAGVEAFVPGTGGFVTYPCTFNGLKAGTLDPGGVLISDPLGIHLQAATSAFFYTRTYVTTANQYPLGVQPYNPDGEGFVAATDLTGYNAAGGFTGSGFLFGPWLVLGTTLARRRVVVGAVGDSIITGAKNQQRDGATVTTTTNDRSFIDAALNGQLPLVKVARSSDLAATFRNTRLTQARHAALAACTHVVIHYGRNDLANATTAAVLYGYLQTVCQYVRLQGARAVLCTMLPETTSTDNWTTAAGQTVTAREAARVTLNGLIRGAVAAGDADAVVDLAALIEADAANAPALDGGRWLTNGVTKHYTWDGIHPAYDGNVLLGTAAGLQPAAFGA